MLSKISTQKQQYSSTTAAVFQVLPFVPVVTVYVGVVGAQRGTKP